MFLKSFVKLENCGSNGLVAPYIKGVYVRPEEISHITVYNYGDANNRSPRQDTYYYHMKSGEKFQATKEQHERNLAKIDGFLAAKGIEIE